MDFTSIGKIINTHGIKGEVKIYPLTDDVNRFKELKTAFIGPNKDKVTIKTVKFQKNLVILKFDEFNDINEVLKYKDTSICVDEENLVELPEDHYFIFDLIGLKVYDMASTFIGELKDVIEGRSNDVYIIRNEELDKEYLIPAVGAFIKEIDIEENKMIIDPIEGMIEW